jgi:hypothetical protein
LASYAPALAGTGRGRTGSRPRAPRPAGRAPRAWAGGWTHARSNPLIRLDAIFRAKRATSVVPAWGLTVFSRRSGGSRRASEPEGCQDPVSSRRGAVVLMHEAASRSQGGVRTGTGLADIDRAHDAGSRLWCSTKTRETGRAGVLRGSMASRGTPPSGADEALGVSVRLVRPRRSQESPAIDADSPPLVVVGFRLGLVPA